jgi:hypothetical protein
MDNVVTGSTRQRIAGLAVLALLFTGCAQTSDWLQGRRSAPSGGNVILGAPAADVYLEELRLLAAGDPVTQAEIFADADAGAKLTPGPNTRLRLALVLATPGHSESNPELAQSILREVMTQTLLLTPAEIALATIHLNNVEVMIVANAEARRLRTSSSRATRTEERWIDQQLKTVEAENRQLRRELDEAEEKLEAITTIERSIREQE